MRTLWHASAGILCDGARARGEPWQQQGSEHDDDAGDNREPSQPAVTVVRLDLI
jgi:hypothetical protein